MQFWNHSKRNQHLNMLKFLLVFSTLKLKMQNNAIFLIKSFSTTSDNLWHLVTICDNFKKFKNFRYFKNFKNFKNFKKFKSFQGAAFTIFMIFSSNWVKWSTKAPKNCIKRGKNGKFLPIYDKTGNFKNFLEKKIGKSKFSTDKPARNYKTISNEATSYPTLPNPTLPYHTVPRHTT